MLSLFTNEETDRASIWSNALNTLLPAFTVVVGKGAETGEREVHVEIVLEVQVYNGERLQIGGKDLHYVVGR